MRALRHVDGFQIVLNSLRREHGSRTLSSALHAARLRPALPEGGFPYSSDQAAIRAAVILGHRRSVRLDYGAAVVWTRSAMEATAVQDGGLAGLGASS